MRPLDADAPYMVGGNGGSIDEGRPAMTQVIVWMLLMGIVGLSWVIILDILGNDLHPHDNR
jgi:hypothetical protein